MSIQQELNEGARLLLQKFSTHFKDTSLSVLNVFRYWTSYFIIESLTLDSAFKLRSVPDLLRKFGLDPENSKIPIVACLVEKPLPSILLLALDSYSSPSSVHELVTDLIQRSLLFRYHVMIFHPESLDFLLWNTHKFQLDTSELVHVAEWIAQLYSTFDYHYIVQTAHLLSARYKKEKELTFLSVGPTPLTLEVKKPFFMNPTLISWEEMFFQLIQNVALIPGDVHILYLASLFPPHKHFKGSFPPDVFIHALSALPDFTLERAIKTEQELKTFVFAHLKDSRIDPDQMMTTIVLPILELEFKLWKIRYPSQETVKSFGELSPINQQQLIQIMWPTVHALDHIYNLIQKETKHKIVYFVLAFPALHKYFIDTLLTSLVRLAGYTDRPDIQTLFPNTRWLPYSVAVPFHLERVPWLPNLLQHRTFWYLTDDTKQIFSKIVKDNQTTKLVFDPYLAKSRDHICMWNAEAEKCKYVIRYSESLVESERYSIEVYDLTSGKIQKTMTLAEFLS